MCSRAPRGLAPLAFGNSDSVRVGDPVVAIGNPFGLRRTATAGIVSAVQERTITAPNGYPIDHVIQTDAQINSGNSGGPLLNARGEVIGVSSQIARADGSTGNVGIGFAVPSVTALPIIETQAGDVSAYIPTNVISITDGQIFLQTDLFNQGQRPAVNAGISVSRVGGNAQIKAMRQVAGKLRLDLAQYRELAAFAQFASDLDKATRDQLTRGRALTEVLKQPQFQPLAVEKQVAIIWAATNGHLDDVAPEKIGEFETGFYRFLESEHKKLLPAIAKEKALSDKLTAELEKAVTAYKDQSGLGKADDDAAAKAKAEAAEDVAEKKLEDDDRKAMEHGRT